MLPSMLTRSGTRNKYLPTIMAYQAENPSGRHPERTNYMNSMPTEDTHVEPQNPRRITHRASKNCHPYTKQSRLQYQSEEFHPIQKGNNSSLRSFTQSKEFHHLCRLNQFLPQ
jgi:hypothetical protein